MTPSVSDETIHAFVDGELALREREAFTARMREDDALAQRVCRLRSLKNMVQLGYAEPPPPPVGQTRHTPPKLFLQRCAFGCLVVLAGVGGWMLRGVEGSGAAAGIAPLVMPPGYEVVTLARQADPSRVLLHLDSAAPDRMQAVLDQAERLLDAAAREGTAMQLEVIANSRGIQLLRAGHSPHAARMARMKQRHANLQWVACGQSIARLTSEGQKVELLPTTRTAPTAISEIVTRLQQGWTYVRV